MEEISRPELQRFYYRREKLFRVRLVIALPLIFAILAAIPSFLCLSIVDNIFASNPDLYSTQQIRNTMMTLQMVAVASVCFALLCGILFSNLLTAPLKKLSDLLLDMAEKGRIEPMNVQLGDEIAILGESYNRMVMSMSKYLPERARFVFHNLASGVITFGFESGIIDTINSAADKMMELHGKGIVGKKIFKVFKQYPGMKPLEELFKQVMLENKPVKDKEINITTTEGNPLSLLVSTSIVTEPDGINKVVIATLMNLSRIREISNRLILDERLSAVGSLAAGVAHEIRNPLGSLRGLTQLLEENIPTDDKSQQYLKVIISEVDRLNGVVQQLLDFAVPDDTHFKKCNLEEIVNRSIELVVHQIKNNIRLTTDIAQNIPPVTLRKERIIQLLLDLLINAIEATPPEHDISIKTTHDSEEVKIEITNTGSTVPDNIKRQIFDPFFTTKERGTGLGLAICHQITTQHNGNIDMRTGDNFTSFIVTLPIEQKEGIMSG